MIYRESNKLFSNILCNAQNELGAVSEYWLSCDGREIKRVTKKLDDEGNKVIEVQKKNSRSVDFGVGHMKRIIG